MVFFFIHSRFKTARDFKPITVSVSDFLNTCGPHSRNKWGKQNHANYAILRTSSSLHNTTALFLKLVCSQAK